MELSFLKGMNKDIYGTLMLVKEIFYLADYL